MTVQKSHGHIRCPLPISAGLIPEFFSSVFNHAMSKVSYNQQATLQNLTKARQQQQKTLQYIKCKLAIQLKIKQRNHNVNTSFSDHSSLVDWYDGCISLRPQKFMHPSYCFTIIYFQSFFFSFQLVNERDLLGYVLVL